MNTYETPAAAEAPRKAAAGQTSGPAVSQGKGPAGPDTPRTWTVELPPLELLNANDRRHHMAAARLTRAIREAAGWTARAAHVPHMRRAVIIAELRFPDTRKRDPANWAPSAKPAVDGLVDAGVLADDDAAHVVGPDMRLGDPDRSLKARGLTGHAVLVLHITELPEEIS